MNISLEKKSGYYYWRLKLYPFQMNTWIKRAKKFIGDSLRVPCSREINISEESNQTAYFCKLVSLWQVAPEKQFSRMQLAESVDVN